MMWAPAMPGIMSHGPPSDGSVESPEDSGVANGV